MLEYALEATINNLRKKQFLLWGQMLHVTIITKEAYLKITEARMEADSLAASCYSNLFC